MWRLAYLLCECGHFHPQAEPTPEPEPVRVEWISERGVDIEYELRRLDKRHQLVVTGI